jgi:hypothetical protein
MKKNYLLGSSQHNLIRPLYLKWLIVACVFYSTHSGSRAACQDSPKEFYPKGFVQQPTSPKSPGSPRTQSSPPGQPSKQQEAKVIARHQQSVADESAHQTPRSIGSSTHTATEVSVFVNSLDPTHLNRVIAKVLSLQSRGKIHFGAIMHMGNSQNISSQQEKALESQGIMLMGIFELPANLPITRSPAWVVTEVGPNGEQQARLVEGYFDIEQFFDQYGRFAVPAGIEVERPSEKAVEKLEGF